MEEDHAPPTAGSRAVEDLASLRVEDIELEPVSAVQRNFDALGKGFSALKRAVASLAARPTGASDDALKALTQRLNSLEHENGSLKDRVAELERQAYDPPSPTQDGPAETIAARVAALEGRADASDVRATEQQLATQKEFGDVWAELHLLQQRLTKVEARSAGEGGDFVSRAEYDAFYTDSHVARKMTQASLRDLAEMTGAHRKLLDEHDAAIKALLAEALRGDALREWLERLDAESKQASQRLNGHDQDIDDVQRGTERALRAADAAMEQAAVLSARVGEVDERLTTRLDRLAASTAKSLKAIDLALAALRKQRAAATQVAAKDDAPLLTKLRAPCLSCEPSTAAELRNEAVRRRPAAPATPNRSSGRQHVRGRSPATSSVTPTQGRRDESPRRTVDVLADGFDEDEPRASLAHGVSPY